MRQVFVFTKHERIAPVSRQSVQNWFDVLVDTLLGSWLPAWKLSRATKQLGYPLFFWRTPDGVEVDRVCETASGYTAIEVKAAAG